MNQESLQCLTESDMRKVFDALPLDVVATLFSFPQLFLAGGFIRAVLAGEEVKDIDIFTTDTSIIPDVVRHYVRQCGDMGVAEVATPCTITVRGNDMVPVQFVNNVAYDSPAHCLKLFDFTVCQAAYWYDRERGWQSLCAPEFIRDVAAKRLVYTAPNRVEAPGGSLWRAFKYAQRGYSITQAELAKLVVRLNASTILHFTLGPDGWPCYDADVHGEQIAKSFTIPGTLGGSY